MTEIRPDDPRDDDVRRARRGDRAALERLFLRYEDDLRAFANRKIGPALRNKLRTSDLLQSTYLAALRDIEQFEGVSPRAFLGWVKRIFENTIRDKGRYFEVRRRHGETPTPEQPDVDDGRPGPITQAEFGDDLRLFMRAFAQLPEDYEEVLTLARLEGLSHREIGARMGRSETAIAKLVSRARAEFLVQLRRLRIGDGDGG